MFSKPVIFFLHGKYVYYLLNMKKVFGVKRHCSTMYRRIIVSASIIRNVCSHCKCHLFGLKTVEQIIITINLLPREINNKGTNKINRHCTVSLRRLWLYQILFIMINISALDSPRSRLCLINFLLCLLKP